MSVLQQLKTIFSSPSYADRIPEATRNKIATNGFGEGGQYTPDEYNSIFGQLLNMVAKIQNFSFKYAGVDFEKYNKGFISYGDAILDNFIDLADVLEPDKLINAEGNNGGATTTDPYRIKWADVKTAYYVGTYDLKYMVTTRLVDVRKAFISDASVQNFIMLQKSVLPESLKYDKYLIVRNMLADRNIYAVSKDFAITPVSASEPILSAEQALTIISQIKNYVDSASFNNPNLNKLGAHSSIKDDGKNHGVLFMNMGIYNAIKTALKNVYHNEIDFGVETLELIPDFGENSLTTGQFACLLDDRGLYLYDTLLPYMWEIWTGDAMYWNTFLNYQGKVAYALHRTAVMFTLSEGA